MDAMSLNLLNVEDFIKKYDVKEVTSTRTLSSGNMVNPLGLFSTEIFGDFGSQDRMEKFGYIDLGIRILHPLVYHMMLKMSGKINEVIIGAVLFDVKEENKKVIITENNKSGTHTGLNFIYDYFPDFIEYLFKDTGTKSRRKYLDFLSNFSKEELFISKYLIIPAGIRDLNMMDFERTGTINYEPINELYFDLLRRTEASKSSADSLLGEDFQLPYNIQKSCLTLYLELTNSLAGKDGLLQSKSLKKPIAYAVRSVIVSSNKIQDTYNSELSSNIELGQVGIPVSIMISQFYPFVIHELNNLVNNKSISYFNDFLDSEIISKEEKELTDAQVVDMFIDYCTKDVEFLKKVMFVLDGHKIYVMDFLKNEIFTNIVGTKSNPKRYTTGTRYPITGQFSVQILFPVPYTTDFVKIVELSNGLKWELTLNPDLYSSAIRMNDLSLEPYGADYDGDKMTFIGIFSDDANSKIIKENKSYRDNNLTLSLSAQAKMTNETLLGLEFLTRKI